MDADRSLARVHYSHHHSQLSQAGPPPPPSMSNSNNPPPPSSYGYDLARRRSLTGGSPSNYTGTAPAITSRSPSSIPAKTPIAPSHDPPPPPSFTRPQMPPPSSPPQQQTHASQAQRPSYPSAFGANRELPGLGQALRPGSSMSISSLIGGGDTGTPSQASQAQTSPPTHASSNSLSMQPPSPRRGLPSGPRSEFPPFRRQPSPERSMYGSNASRPSDGPGYPAGSPTRSYSNHGSPELGRHSLPPTTQPYKPLNFHGQRLYPPGESTRPSTGGVPPRPNSQPTGPPGPSEHEGRPLYEAFGGRRTAYGPPEERRRTLGESARPNAAELLGGPGQSASERTRPITVHPVSQSLFSPPREPSNAGPSSEPARNLWRHSAQIDTPRESTDIRRDESQTQPRPYGPYISPSLGAPRYGGPGTEDLLRGRNVEQLSNHRAVEQYHAPPTSDPNSVDRQRTEPLARSLSSSGRSLYDQPQRMGEAMQLSKSHIGFGLDANRRTGRASPLPQAVQGAQAQPISVGQNPGIKSEFGRMFSGLGSGLGSSTPSRGSPMPQNGQGSFSHESESGDMMRLQRVGSQQGRKPQKRVKDEDSVFDVESGDGRGTPSGSRGAKRNKHHHHHPPHHQYVENPACLEFVLTR